MSHPLSSPSGQGQTLKQKIATLRQQIDGLAGAGAAQAALDRDKPSTQMGEFLSLNKRLNELQSRPKAEAQKPAAPAPKAEEARESAGEDQSPRARLAASIKITQNSVTHS